MSYQIIITKTEKNTDFEAQMKDYRESQRWNGRSFDGNEMPRSNVVKDVLICELTDAQFTAVKAAVLKEFV